MPFDIEKGTLRGRSLAVLLVGVASFVWFLSPYLTSAESMKAHLDAYPAFVLDKAAKDAKQDQAIALLQKDIDNGIKHRERVEDMILEQARRAKAQTDMILEHLSRLKLISTDKHSTNLTEGRPHE